MGERVEVGECGITNKTRKVGEPRPRVDLLFVWAVSVVLRVGEGGQAGGQGRAGLAPDSDGRALRLRGRARAWQGLVALLGPNGVGS